MDVIGAGFGRTGTLSLKIALEMLGFGPCLHMVPVLDEPERATLFRQAADGDPESLTRALAGYRSTVDWPGTYFWRDLVERHPRARVVLTVRDPQQWYDSAFRTLHQAALRAPRATEGAAAGLAMIERIVWDGTFGGQFADREHTVRVFEEHNDAVRRTVPADRLLEFEVTQGWEPLCAFVGVEAPGAPFPHSNTTAEFQERIRQKHSEGRL